VPQARSLPPHPHLTHLRKQAKALLGVWRGGDRQILARVREVHPRAADRWPSLADAQLVVAREYGFGSWTQLVHYLRLPQWAQARHTLDRLSQRTRAAALTAIPAQADARITLGSLLEGLTLAVWQAHLDGDPAVAGLVRAALGTQQAEQTVERRLNQDDVRAFVAHEHGFSDWAVVTSHRDAPVDPHFEAAADAIVAGDLEALRVLLDTHQGLARARSPFGHHATLIHYVAANGVESSRQWQSPRNAVDILRVLLRHGGDPDATCDVYGGGMTPLCLVVSSAHPATAGVQAGLVEELCRGGANPDGLDNDGLPLWTAITYGYPPAVDKLVASGARVDNLVFASAAGDLAKASAYLQRGAPPGLAARVGIRGPRLDPDHLLEYALIYSAGLGRRAVVELLLTRGPDLTVIEPVFRSTAAGAARYHHRSDILALLEATIEKRGQMTGD